MYKNNKLISIVTVVYNGDELLEDTINSVIHQTLVEIEYIIIDGGSTDKSINVINKYDNKITAWISEPDKGIYDAMNKGIEMASGEWILFMNCGDLFVSNNTVSTIVPFLTEDVNIVYGDTVLNYSNSKVFKLARDFGTILYDIPFCHQSVFVRSALLKRYKFDLNYKYAADYNFFLNLFINKESNAQKVSVPVSVYDMFGVSNGIGALREYYQISKKYYPNSWATFKHYLRLKRYLYKSKLKEILPKRIVDLIKK